MNDRARITLVLLLLLLAGGLRLYRLEAIPPGLTHDEADHALDAAGILEGRRPITFTVGYGREPLYDYSTAPVMLVVGQNYLASRLTAALYGLALLAICYAWARRATGDEWLAMAILAVMAVDFWTVSASREALRSITQPVTYMAAALCLWPALKAAASGPFRISDFGFLFFLSGFFLGLSFYTYLNARGMWAVFPAFWLYLAIWRRDVFRRAWPGFIVMAVVAAAVAAPLFLYLHSHPDAMGRLTMLSEPLAALQGGDPGPLLDNLRAAPGLFTVWGDDIWLYNIPGRPLLWWGLGALFYVGLVAAVVGLFGRREPPPRPWEFALAQTPQQFEVKPRTATPLQGGGSPTKSDGWGSEQNRQTGHPYRDASAFMLLTLAAGLVPATITGLDAANTRVIGLMPALYYFPALAAAAMGRWLGARLGRRAAWAVGIGYGLLVAATLGITVRDYFVTWANARDVRVAYHHTLVETIHYLDAHPDIPRDVALSSITPGPFHDPSVLEMTLQRGDLTVRWFDARSALIFPDAGESLLVFPETTPLDPALAPIFEPHAEPFARIALRPDDFNREVALVRFRAQEALSEALAGAQTRIHAHSGDVYVTPEMTEPRDLPLRFGESVTLLGYRVMVQEDAVEVITFWQVMAPTQDEIVLFTHAVDPANRIVGQQDVLGVPSRDNAEYNNPRFLVGWRTGDAFAQVHRFGLAEGTDENGVLLEVGAYTQPDLVRLPVSTLEGESLGTRVILTWLGEVAP
jgi:hypothetical protein